MKKLILLATALCLCGCATVAQPLSTQRVQVGNQIITYVFGVPCRDSLGLNLAICDRYGPDGKLLAHDAATEQGLLHQTVTSAVQSSAAMGALEGIAGTLMPSVTVKK